MPLRLRVISDHRRPLGAGGTITFGAAGGTIGRSSDNDWVLPDPQRYVSAHHARVHYRQGQYELEDTSTNGLYVNEEAHPVKEYGSSYRLKHGDVLRIGEYEVAVALAPGGPGEESATAPSADAPAVTDDEPVPTRIDELYGLGRVAQTDLGAVLNLDELLVAPEGRTDRSAPVNVYGQPARPSHPIASDVSGVAEPPNEAPGPGEQTLARRLERLARAANRAEEARSAQQAAPPEVQTGLQAFCRGAGLDSRLLPPDAQARLLQLVGQLFREALVGLKDLERAREAIRDRFHIELSADPEDPRPSLVGSTIEELLVRVLSQAERRQFDAVQWIRETMGAAKAHERAMSEALREAFVEYIDRLDPAELEARFERTARRAQISGSAEARNWKLFAEFYRSLTEMSSDQLPHTFLETFANGYRKALRIRS